MESIREAWELLRGPIEIRACWDEGFGRRTGNQGSSLRSE